MTPTATGKGKSVEGEQDPPLSLRDEQKQFTRARLLESAITLFRERGYAATTVQDIAKAANASRATFYLHFKDKDEVVLGILDLARPDIERQYEALDAALAEDSLEQLQVWMREAIEWFEQRQALAIALEQVITSGGEMGERVTEWFNFTDSMPGFLEKAGDEVQARLRVWLLVTLLSHLSVAWKANNALPEVDKGMMVSVLSEIWAPALGLSKP